MGKILKNNVVNTGGGSTSVIFTSLDTDGKEIYAGRYSGSCDKDCVLLIQSSGGEEITNADITAGTVFNIAFNLDKSNEYDFALRGEDLEASLSDSTASAKIQARAYYYP